MNAIDSMYKTLIKRNGIDGKINNIPCKFLIGEESDNGENGYDLKYIVTDKTLSQGDYIDFNNTLYMIIDVEKPINSMYTKGIFREVLKITLQSSLKDVYAVVDKIRGIFNQGNVITEINDEYKFIIPKSTTNWTSSNPSNNAIIYAGGSYHAISIDDSKEGILTITGRFDSLYIPHEYTISLEDTTKTLVETETYTIVPTCKDNGAIVENPTITYLSSDETVVTVTEKGVVSALKEGSATITCTYNGVSATFNLTVDAKSLEPVISYSTTWSNSNGVLLRLMSSTTFVATKTVDGVDDPNLVVNYEFDETGKALISGNKLSITKKADASYLVKNTNTNTVTYINITFTDASDGTVIEVKNIKLQGM